MRYEPHGINLSPPVLKQGVANILVSNRIVYCLGKGCVIGVSDHVDNRNFTILYEIYQGIKIGSIGMMNPFEYQL